jgi:hypothetical protein
MDSEIIINAVPITAALISIMAWILYSIKYTIHWIISVVTFFIGGVMFYMIAKIDVGLMLNKDWIMFSIVTFLYLIITMIPPAISMYFDRDKSK